MSILPDGEWDGICACGRDEQDGKRCALGATHQPSEKPTAEWKPLHAWDSPSLEDLLA